MTPIKRIVSQPAPLLAGLGIRQPAHLLAGLVCALALASAPFAAHAADLTVLVDNVAGDAGQVLVGLFDKAETFPRDLLRGERVPASTRDASGRVKLVFTGLAPGRYALSAFHDVDDNGKLNANVMGLPTEPYGFSRDARGNFGPPTFADAAFDVPEAGLTITVRVQ